MTSPVIATARRLIRTDPQAWLIGLGYWIAFHGWPLLTGFALKVVLDRLAGDSDGSVWTARAVLAGLEVGRWVVFLGAVVQWGGAWVGFETVSRVSMLRSLVADPGPSVGRLPSSPGEAVSRFRDDVRDLNSVVDVWIDITAASVTTAIALLVLAAVDVRATLVLVVPVLAALGFARWLGPRLKAWRAEARTATAAVTGFLGDLFGATLAVKAAGAEAAASRRFVELNDARRRSSRRDQVGTALVVSLSGVTGELGVGLVLLVTAPALQRGELSVGDIGLFTTYVVVLANLPRWAGRLSSYHRQAEVSVARLAELHTSGDPRVVVETRPDVDLRHGPAPLRLPSPSPAPLTRLSARGLTARYGGPDGPGIEGVDLDVGAGQLVVVTGPVGSGKSTLLRALLGLVERQAGEIRWDGALVEDPSVELVPPRVAYVPQVPRLFSEALADTVLLGLPDDGLLDALELACLSPDIDAMPDGVRTAVGPRGVRLSGGQVQRVATARALVRRTALLVVDDLSSALDVATETRLWDGLLADRTRTALVVTHRPQVIARADVVLELGAKIPR